jgi:hypothetical protein
MRIPSSQRSVPLGPSDGTETLPRHLSFAENCALTGVTLDPSGALLQDATVTLANQDTGQTGSTVSDEEGRFGFLLLTPGKYELCASKTDFATVCSSGIGINVTETRRIELRLQLATVANQVQVTVEPKMLQTDNSALGRIVNETAVTGLPLVTRNFAQIASLSPGVVALGSRMLASWASAASLFSGHS